MCGIFGFIQTEANRSQNDLSRALIRKLCLLSETRGKDASGLVSVTSRTIRTLKRAVRAKTFLSSKEFEQFFQDTTNELAEGPTVFMGHTRMVTNGDSERHSNNQPCIGKTIVCIHNGIVVNETTLWDNEGLSKGEGSVDTQVIIALMERHYSETGSFAQALRKTYSKIKGANSTAFVTADLSNLYLATANGSLFVAVSPNKGLILFASEKYILEEALRYKKLNIQDSGAFIITQLRPNTMCSLSFAAPELRANFFQLDDLIEVKDDKITPPRTLFDFPPAPAGTQTTKPYTGTFTALEKLCQFDTTPIENLKRCSKCLLPESFPYIEFDHEGVCNYCHSYTPWAPTGTDSLRELLAPARKNDGSPDCLVPVSGGRDSSYALHCICKELGMNPVAYTYDWGMVTDLARRNISRMCGELGIEHVLVSANIKQKRANIRKNVLAWLKSPHLGTVTLFMAGDKPYYYYAYMVRRQMNLKYTLLGANHLERTDFKVGFCNIDEKFGKERHYSLNMINKFKLLGFFGKQFLTNPSYLNNSLLDTALGFASYYILPCDYISLYDYVPWDEQTINRTLLSFYDWETASDTNSTWRIGDGTAAFYNYIYYKMAGFSENDTFRSNQIRQGVISREEALEKIKSDNNPRVESIKWYCDTIGVDPHQTIEQINEAATLYAK